MTSLFPLVDLKRNIFCRTSFSSKSLSHSSILTDIMELGRNCPLFFKDENNSGPANKYYLTKAKVVITGSRIKNKGSRFWRPFDCIVDLFITSVPAFLTTADLTRKRPYPRARKDHIKRQWCNHQCNVFLLNLPSICLSSSRSRSNLADDRLARYAIFPSQRDR